MPSARDVILKHIDAGDAGVRRRGAAATTWERAELVPAPRESWAEAEPYPYWLDSPARPSAREPLSESQSCDLVIVGAGLSGLWAALLAKERNASREVVLLDAGRLATGASGRNGGFLDSSLTHGLSNGIQRYPEEMQTLDRLGAENFAAIQSFITSNRIGCGFESVGTLLTAVEPHEVDWLLAAERTAREFGHEVEFLDAGAVKEQLYSPSYVGGLWEKSGSALVDPARLAWGLAELAVDAGVRIFEDTEVTGLRRRSAGVEVRAGAVSIHTSKVLLATAAARGLLRSIRRRVIPVYDYVLVSERLDEGQLSSLRWENRQGISDCGNQFHYYRLTEDNRILFGGFDAVYHFANGHNERLEQSDRSSARLAAHFFALFPQLEGLRFTHRWGGAIDTCSRFFAFYGSVFDGDVAYSVGHTGLGVGASRFGASVALDLLDGVKSEALTLRAIRSRPMPFPPEPLRWLGVALTRNRLAAADRNQGKRGIWLRTLDRLGLGFDS
jgi:glycine/D-amino acid oxidase-like deaminating enzyme